MRRLSKRTSSLHFRSIDFWFRFLIYALPVVLIFSYYPVISFGAGKTMNFELSLPMTWLVVFDVVGIVKLLQERKLRELMRWWKWILFPVFITISLIWSENLIRGALTCGVMWLVVMAILTIVMFKRLLMTEEFRRNFLRWFFGATLCVCGWCMVQCVMDILGAPREYSLMCLGCSSYSFGFPHPNGFAVEPQFMGNLLLAPAMMTAWLCVQKQDGRNFKSERSRLKFLLPCFFITVSTLFLVFSRGAIYAFIVGLAILSGMMLVRARKQIKYVVKRLAIVWGVMVVAFLFALNLQGVMAQIGPTNDTYASGVAKVLNQLSLGVIDIRVKNETSVEMVEAGINNSVNGEEAIFDGYVEESTEIRKMMTRNAIKVWSRDFRTMMLGVGIGGAGEALYGAGLTGWPKEIVQNEYASILLETGLVGIILVLVLAAMVIRVLKQSLAMPVLVALMAAYAVSLIFFSGLMNALQIYLMTALFVAMFATRKVNSAIKT